MSDGCRWPRFAVARCCRYSRALRADGGSRSRIFVIFAVSLHIPDVGRWLARPFGPRSLFRPWRLCVAFHLPDGPDAMIVSLLVGPLLGLLARGVGRRAIVRSGLFRDADPGSSRQIVWSIAFQWSTVTVATTAFWRVAGEMARPASFYFGCRRLAALAVVVLRVMCSRRSALHSAPQGIRRAQRSDRHQRQARAVTAFVIAAVSPGLRPLFAYLKGSVFPDSLGISLWSMRCMVLPSGAFETVSGAGDRRHRLQGAQHLAGQQTICQNSCSASSC